MNLALRTSVFGHLPIEAAAAAIAQAGYEAVVLELEDHGLSLAEGQWTPALASRIADAFDSEDLVIAALSARCDLAAEPEVAAAKVSAMMGLAGHFGADLVVGLTATGDDWTVVLDTLRDLLEDAEERDLALVVDVRPDSAVSELDHAELLLDSVDSDSLGLALDPVALSSDSDVDLEEVLERVGDSILLASLSDVTEQGSPIAPAEGGETDFAELFELLNEYVPDLTVVPVGTTPANAAATRAYLASLW